VVPQVNSFLELLGEDPAGLDAATRRRDENTSRQMQDEMFAAKEDEDFIQRFRADQRTSLMDNDEDPVASYNPKPTADLPQSDISLSKEDVVQANAGEFNKVKVKLANYGYDSDSSPDYNSNVLKIGHSNNKLVDGRSAALTKSLAKRYGLKSGDEFEVLTADGEVMVRTYDDTVPTTYKGKPLPETVDLYDTKGSNSFGGTVVGIRKRSNSRSLDLVAD